MRDGVDSSGGGGGIFRTSGGRGGGGRRVLRCPGRAGARTVERWGRTRRPWSTPGRLAPPLRPARRVLLSLLALDALLVGLGAVHVLWLRDVRWLSLGADAGLAETVQHLKTLAVVAGGAVLFRRTRQPAYAALAALFLALFVDDVATLHEVGGEWLAVSLGLPAVAGLRPQDTGEVAVLASWAVPLSLLVAATYGQSDRRARSDVRRAAWAVVALATFGVGVDAVHQAALGLGVHGLPSVLTAVEEGGELAVVSVIAAGTVGALRARWGGVPAAPGGGGAAG